MAALTADFQKDYGAALRKLHLNESEIARQTKRVTAVDGIDAETLAQRNFDAIIDERNQRVAAKARMTLRRLICGTCMIVPISGVLALAIWYITL